MDRYNSEGYPVPTAYNALTAVAREERRNRKPSPRKRVYICSPYRGETEAAIAENVRLAIRYCQMAVRKGCLPFAPHIYLTRFLDDAKPDERKLGLSLGLEILRDCQEVWVCGGTVSAGMKNEIAEAKRLGITITTIEN
jgi:hypothetical protein